jgi:hypothetical protein
LTRRLGQAKLPREADHSAILDACDQARFILSGSADGARPGCMENRRLARRDRVS